MSERPFAFEMPPVKASPDWARIEILDQRVLPAKEDWLQITELEELAQAIESLAVRGAPAIGCAAALGLGVLCGGFGEGAAFEEDFKRARERLAATRPTAVNLFVALEQMRASTAGLEGEASQRRQAIRAAARAHVEEDLNAGRAMARHGMGVLPAGGILTHCNTGPLATAGVGTALGVIMAAHEAEQGIHVWVDETRPLLQGGRLTSWELQRAGVPATLITDSMAASLMRAGKIQAAIVGADRITARGDVANKIGTYGVALACKHHGLPFYVAAPWTTIDLSLESGEEIEIEQRDPREVRGWGSAQWAPQEVSVFNPAFDVTPAELVSAIITERGVFAPSELRAAANGAR